MIEALLVLALLQQPAPESVTEAVVAPGSERVVRTLSLDIPKGIERAEVVAILETRAGAPYSPAEVDIDVRRLFAALPLENVRVYVEPGATGDYVDLRFELLPRVLVGRIDLDGNANLEREDILGVLDVKEGGEFREGRVAGMAPAVERLYGEHGYFQAKAEVEVTARRDRSVSLRVTIREGKRARFGKVAIVGPPPGFGWMRSAMGLEVGDSYSEQALRVAQDALSQALADRGHREYQMSEPVVTYDPSSNQVNVSLAVETGPRVEFRFAGNRFFNERDLSDTLGIEEVRQLTPGTVDEFSSRLRDLYQNWGFYHAEVDMLQTDDASENLRIYLYRIREGAQRFIKDVRFVGNESRPDDTLYEAQAVRNRRWFDVLAAPNRGASPAGERETNVQALTQTYQRQGFLSASVVGVTVEPQDGGALVLTYSIVEGAQTLVGSLVFTGAEAFDELQLRNTLLLEPGMPFDPFAFEDGLERIRRLYQRAGFIEAKAAGETRYPKGAESVALEVRIQEGAQYRIGQIFLQGNTRTGDEVLRRSLAMASGDLLNPERLLDTQRTVYRLGIFGSVMVEVLSKDPQAKIANVIVKVQEKRNGSVDFGLEVGSAEGVILSTEAAHRNLWGTARSLRGRAEVSYRFENFSNARTNAPYPNEFRVETSYREPWLLDTQWAGTLSYITERNRREKTYNLTANKVVLGGDREIGRHWRALPNYSWEKDTFFAKEPPADCDADEAWTDSHQEAALRTDRPARCDANPKASQTNPASVFDIESNVNLGSYYIAGIEPVLVGDYLNDRFTPTRGSLITFRLFYGIPALGSDFHFVRPDLLVGNYFELAPGLVLGLGVRAGYVALLPPTENLIKPQKYVLGGANSVRGYGLKEIFVPIASGTIESREDGGSVMLNYQSELRFPLMWGLSGVVFHDAGQVWSGFDRVSLPLLYSAGPGLRYDTPVGPIRLDFGWKLNRDDAPCASASGSCDISPYEVHFAIGNAF